METILTNVVNFVNDILWNKWLLLLFLLLGSGIYFTIRTRFVQVRKFGSGLRMVFGSINLRGKAAGKDGMSSFQALATAIAAQVGTGNIAGCASALVAGGPGAVFWMWVSAFFGMATSMAKPSFPRNTATLPRTAPFPAAPFTTSGRPSGESWAPSSPASSP